MTPRLSIAMAATLLALSTALAGCTAGGSSTGGGTSPAPGAAASAKPPAHTAFTIPTTCLSAAEVSGLLGLPEYGPTSTASTGSLVCEYLTATEDGAIIDYETRPGMTPETLAANLKSNPPDNATVTAISHLGDAAYDVQTGDGEVLMLLTGPTLINIAGGPTTLPRLESLAVDVLAG